MERETFNFCKRTRNELRPKGYHLNTFAVLASALVDVLAGCIGADKGDGFDVRVVTDPVDCIVCAVHNVQDAPAQQPVSC